MSHPAPLSSALAPALGWDTAPTRSQPPPPAPQSCHGGEAVSASHSPPRAGTAPSSPHPCPQAGTGETPGPELKQGDAVPRSGTQNSSGPPRGLDGGRQ